MAKETKAARAERAEAIEKLRGWIKPGDTVYTILDHVSSSGMSRAIRVVVPEVRGLEVESAAPGGKAADYIRKDSVGVDFIHPNYAIGRALGLKHWKRNGREQDALVVGECGMDMGFHLAYELSSVIYGGRGCDCGRWFSERQPTVGYLKRRDDLPEQGDWSHKYDPTCAKCAGGGYLLTSGYACLGKGKCPSNYHVNHHDRIRCEGVLVGEDRRRCWAPGGGFFSKASEIPEDWPRRQIDIGEGKTIEGPPLHVLYTEHDGAPYEVCPTCDGAGQVDNPEGKERFDLRHFDGYALRHRWL